MLYGLSTIALYELLGVAGLPTFYDKLLQVAALNLSIRWIDRAVRSEPLRRLDPAVIGQSLLPRRRNLMYMSVWAVVFAIMSAVQGVGDHHRAQFIPFWQEACQQDRAYACQYLAQLHTNYCRAGSGWACNELGVFQADREVDRPAAFASMQRGCDLRFQPACANVATVISGGPWATGFPPLEDLPILLRGSKEPLTDWSATSLYTRACNQGWPDSCGRVSSAGSQ